MKVPMQSLVVLAGPHNAGKTTIARAFLREVVSENFVINGSIAYVEGPPRGAWLQNADIRNNIIFGKAFNQQLYDQVVAVCGLKQLFQSFPGEGDQKFIDNNTIDWTVRQRISIARALYSKADIYIFDNTLFDLPSPLSSFLFHFAIQRFLHNKTVLFISNEKQYLDVDGVIVYFLVEGKLTLGNLHDATYKLRKSQQQQRQRNRLGRSKTNEEQLKVDFQRWNDTETEIVKTSEELQNAVGFPPFNVNYLTYMTHEISDFQAFLYFIGKGGTTGVLMFILSLMCLTFSATGMVASFWWLQYWVTQVSHSLHDWKPCSITLLYYGLMIFGQFLFLLLFFLAYLFVSLIACRNIHDTALYHIVGTSIAFLEAYPPSSILTVFKDDMNVIDMQFFGVSSQFLVISFGVLCTLACIGVGSPFALVVVPFFVFVIFQLHIQYHNTKDDMEHLQKDSNNHLEQYFNEALAGRTYIRSLNQGRYIFEEFKYLVDQCGANNFALHYLNTWFGLRLSIVGVLVYLVTFTTVIISRTFVLNYNPGLLALAITLASDVGSVFKSFGGLLATQSTYIRSIKRVRSVVQLPIEQKFTYRDFKPNWPTEGSIEIVKFNFHYKQRTPILKDINFKAKHGERVMIIEHQRVPANAFVYALFRLIHPESGNIFIDKADISETSPLHVRQMIAILPRGCPMFCGTLKYNLDPGNRYSVDEIWEVLNWLKVPKFVKLSENLTESVSENGSNFSDAQRQILCIACAALKKPKILIIEDPTPTQYMQEISSIIQNSFKDTTIIVISSRLHVLNLPYTQWLYLKRGEGDLTDNVQALIEVNNFNLQDTSSGSL